MKNIVLGIDGTWNRPGQMDSGWIAPTNVIKALRSASGESKDGTPQLVIYEPGIGAYSRSWLQGATGLGIGPMILRTYEALSRYYEPGDNIYIFGFSRGACAVRSLTNLIALCGIVDGHRADDLSMLVRQVYRMYRFRKFSFLPRIEDFRDRHCHDLREIHFIGVWDTVAALGIPIIGLNRLTRPLYRFHTFAMNPCIKNAFHAIAIDEKRRNFQPIFWEEDDCTPGQVVEQTWFPGSHGNVGGGFKDTGLSDCALLWMLAKAALVGLGVDEEYVKTKFEPTHRGAMRVYRWLFPKSRRLGLRGILNESIHWTAAALIDDALADYDSPHLETVYRDGQISVSDFGLEVTDNLWHKSYTSPITVRTVSSGMHY